MADTDNKQVLVSWIAWNNDHFNDEGEPGPTLNLLFDEDSPHRGEVGVVVLFYQTDAKSARVFKDLRSEIREANSGIRVYAVVGGDGDPTDHRAIFNYVRGEMKKLRSQHKGRELIIHVSPGTPAMQTIWVLMGETGFIEPPFRLVQSVARKHRAPGGPATVPVDVGL